LFHEAASARGFLAQHLVEVDAQELYFRLQFGRGFCFDRRPTWEAGLLEARVLREVHPDASLSEFFEQGFALLKLEQVAFVGRS